MIEARSGEGDVAGVALFRSTRHWLLLCGSLVLGFSVLCCGGFLFWMLPQGVLLWEPSSGSWFGWGLFYGAWGLAGVLFGTVVLSEAGAVRRVVEGGGEADVAAWASSFRRTSGFLMATSLLVVALIAGGTVLMCLG